MPAAYRSLFGPTTLASHRGFDAGALEFAADLATKLSAPLFAGTWSRLLIDLNRSAHHPQRIPAKHKLTAAQRNALHDTVWNPFRQDVADAIRTAIDISGHCLHLSVHSFTPVMNGQARTTQVGLLYDPARSMEAELAGQLQSRLRAATGLTIHRNQPYRGVADGHTTALRRLHSGPRYSGIEIEINQAVVSGKDWTPLRELMTGVIAAAVLLEP